MSFWEILNLFGLALVSFGSITAAVSAPTVQYNADGSISIGNNSTTKAERIKIYKRQQRFGSALTILGVGCVFQFIAALGA